MTKTPKGSRSGSRALRLASVGCTNLRVDRTAQLLRLQLAEQIAHGCVWDPAREAQASSHGRSDFRGHGLELGEALQPTTKGGHGRPEQNAEFLPPKASVSARIGHVLEFRIVQPDGEHRRQAPEPSFRIFHRSLVIKLDGAPGAEHAADRPTHRLGECRAELTNVPPSGSARATEVARCVGLFMSPLRPSTFSVGTALFCAH